MHMQIYGGTSIHLHDFEKDTVEEVQFLSEDLHEMPPIHRNVARLYEAVAAGDRTAFMTFEQAVERYRFIDALYKQNGIQGFDESANLTSNTLRLLCIRLAAQISVRCQDHRANFVSAALGNQLSAPTSRSRRSSAV